ncbi:MAG: aldo/keto reductase [Acidobacteria bacterium]|nr:aldo/keto reductase [Acidobacteriota bacterium]
MSLNHYVTLGRSGLRVSPLCLGAMTFGTESGIGTDEVEAWAMFDRYVELGGNFLDTADSYAKGRSEELGKFIGSRSLRDRLVLASKFTVNAEAGNPNAGGNGRSSRTT